MTDAGAGRPIGRTQGAWGLWWLCVLTFGIYYLVWYHRTNRELCSFLGIERDASCMWWSQIIPIYGLICMFKHTSRINQAHMSIGSPVRVSGAVMFFAALWYSSNTRYLQRRINSLWDAATTTGQLAPTAYVQPPA
jgi:hypothetical protein